MISNRDVSKINELLSNGYKTYRRLSLSKWNKDSYDYAIHVKKAKEIVFEDSSSLFIDFNYNKTYVGMNFNTLENGGLYVVFSKDNKFKSYYALSLIMDSMYELIEIKKPNKNAP